MTVLQSEQNSEALLFQEYWKQSMIKYTSDSSKVNEYLKQNPVDFTTGNEELKMFKFSEVNQVWSDHLI